MAQMECGQMDTLCQRSALMSKLLNVILKTKERKTLGKQLCCLNDATQRVASDTPRREPGVVHFLKKCIQDRRYFDILVAPYTELHHIETSKQLELIELMQQVAKTTLLNVLTKETEMSLFATQQKVAVTYIHNNTPFTTEIYPIHQKIRDVCEEKNLPSGERVNLMFGKEINKVLLN